MGRRHFGLGLLALTAVLLAPQVASAQGYGIYEQSACSMGRAGATVASPCEDGSAIFFNPAAMTELRKTTASIGGTLVGARGSFTNDTTGIETDLEELWIPVPAGYLVMPLNERTVVGLGVFVPYGLETRWDSTFEGRYLGYRAVLQAPYVQPTVAFKLSDKVSIGAGVDIVYTNVELQQRADLSVQRVPGSSLSFGNLGIPAGTDFADISVRGKAWGFGGHFGVLVKPSEKFSFGARYLTQATIDTDEGEFRTEQIQTGLRIPVAVIPGVGVVTAPVDPLLAPQFAEGAVLADQSAATEMTHPDQFVVGIAFNMTPAAKLLVDYQWTGWTDFDQIVITTENGLVQTLEEEYENTHGLRIGTDIAVSEGFVLRGGIITHTAGAPDQNVTPSLPEAPRVDYTLGAGIRLTEGISADVAYMYLDQEERAGRTVPRPAPNNGVYQFNAHLLSFGFTMRF